MATMVSTPDAVQGEVPFAFVVLRDGHLVSEQLAEELRHHVRKRLAAHEAPQTVNFVADLPRTTTAKVIRRDLRRDPTG